MDTATLITTIIGSNGIFALITLLIQRHGSKKNGVKRISEQLAELYDKVDENAAVLARTHILRFFDELQNATIIGKDRVSVHYSAVGYCAITSVMEEALHNVIRDNQLYFQDVSLIPYDTGTPTPNTMTE